MALSAAQIEAAITNRQAAKRLSDWTDNTGRVVHMFIGDSNTMKDEYGMVGGIGKALGSRYPVFGTGILGARHKRGGTSRGGGWFAWPYYQSDAALSGGAVRNILSVNNASWNSGTMTMTGTFTGYTWKSGDTFSALDSSGATDLRDHVIVSGDSSAIVLATSPGATGTYDGYINNSAGASSFSSVPTAFHSGWNMPRMLEPYGACMVYDASGTTFNEANIFGFPKNGPIPVNQTLVYTVAHLKAAGSGTIRPGIGHYDGTPTGFGTFAVISGTTAQSTNGTDGDLGFIRVTKAVGQHISPNSSKDVMCFVTPAAGVDTSPVCYLFHYVCAPAVTNGVTVQGFLARGGQTLVDLRNGVDFLSEDSWTNWWSTVDDHFSATNGGDGNRRVCVWIHSGFNDHAATTTLSADGVNYTHTKAGFKANLRDLIQKFKTKYDAQFGAGASDTELYFVAMPSHPISDEPSTSGTIADRTYREGLSCGYRQATAELCDEFSNLIAVDLFALLGENPFSQIYNRGMTLGYTGDPDVDDVIHLQPAGYDFLGGKIVSALSGPFYGGGIGPYVTDVNRQGQVRP